MSLQVGILVSRVHVKKIKTALEDLKLLDRRIRITPEETARPGIADINSPRMLITTTIVLSNNSADGIGRDVDSKSELMKELNLADLIDEVEIEFIDGESTNVSIVHRNPLLQALKKTLTDLPPDLIESLDLTIPDVVEAFPTTYTVYKPLLLLPSHSFTSVAWKKLLSAHHLESPLLQTAWKQVAASVGATHIALNAGIPPSTTSTSTSSGLTTLKEENILRSPTNLTPVYGDFGPPINPQRLSHPTPEDFTSALWVSTSQNGIHQTWAPLYTMFSRGNIREKTRLLTLPSITNAIEEGRSTANQYVPGCTAVDLYAGIGYFSFSYKRAGISKILCWELNPWSIEGLRRGAEKNGWSTQIFSNFSLRPHEEMEIWKTSVQDVDFIVFEQSNEEAVSAVFTLTGGVSPHGSMIPPIRHVNLGFLPTTQRAWQTAVKIMDSQLGGWIHVHENVGVADLETRKDEVVGEMQRLLDRWEGEKGYCGFQRRLVKWIHTEKVKTYAPGVLHVVFDVWVDGMRDAEEII